jgi:hypothetical protein
MFNNLNRLFRLSKIRDTDAKQTNFVLRDTFHYIKPNDLIFEQMINFNLCKESSRFNL